MHILYLDGSGGANNPHDRHFVLAGISVFERSIFHLIKKADEFVASLNLGDPTNIELHASHIYSAKSSPWRQLKANKDRERVLCDAIRLLAQENRSVHPFAVVVEKEALKQEEPPLSVAFEEMMNRFNLFLRGVYAENKEKQRGLVIMDKARQERDLQNLMAEFRVRGTRWGKIRNLAEVPLFTDSRSSRLLQLADLVAYAVWRHYEYADGRFLQLLLPRFRGKDGILHNLVHRTRYRYNCFCPACMSRRGKSTQKNSVRQNPF